MGINLNAHGYQNAKTASPSEFVKLPPGGYLCTVVNAEITYSKEGKPMLMLYLDIADGEFKGYFADATKRTKVFKPDKRWDTGGTFRQNIYNKDDKISPFFKGLLVLFAKENPKAAINFDDFEPDCLRGGMLGFVFAEEEWEYEERKGVRVVPKIPKSVEDILSGNFKIPEFKRKPAQETPKTDYGDLGGTPVAPEDTPF